MALSARNQLLGKITRVQLGVVSASVQLDIGGQKLTSIITKDAAEELGLKEGDEVEAIIKASSVMIMK